MLCCLLIPINSDVLLRCMSSELAHFHRPDLAVGASGYRVTFTVLNTVLAGGSWLLSRLRRAACVTGDGSLGKKRPVVREPNRAKAGCRSLRNGARKQSLPVEPAGYCGLSKPAGAVAASPLPFAPMIR